MRGHFDKGVPVIVDLLGTRTCSSKTKGDCGLVIFLKVILSCRWNLTVTTEEQHQLMAQLFSLLLQYIVFKTLL